MACAQGYGVCPGQAYRLQIALRLQQPVRDLISVTKEVLKLVTHHRQLRRVLLHPAVRALLLAAAARVWRSVHIERRLGLDHQSLGHSFARGAALPRPSEEVIGPMRGDVVRPAGDARVRRVAQPEQEWEEVGVGREPRSDLGGAAEMAEGVQSAALRQALVGGGVGMQRAHCSQQHFLHALGIAHSPREPRVRGETRQHADRHGGGAKGGALPLNRSQAGHRRQEIGLEEARDCDVVITQHDRAPRRALANRCRRTVKPRDQRRRKAVLAHLRVVHGHSLQSEQDGAEGGIIRLIADGADERRAHLQERLAGGAACGRRRQRTGTFLRALFGGRQSV